MLAIRDVNNWVIQELLLEDLAKTQYTRDDDQKGPYFCINVEPHRYNELYCNSNEFPNHFFY